MIHSTAIVSPKAEIASDVEIGPYAMVEDGVEIGEGSVVESHAVVKKGSRIGKKVTIGNFAVVAGLPQDLSFDPRVETYAEIGDGVVLREGVTINRGSQEGQATRVGEHCFFMAQVHLGHDCVVGSRVIIANGAMLGGHVSVGSNSFLGGGSGVHQFCRIGDGVMLGGNSTATLDIAPFTMVAERNQLFGLNVVGLRRRGVKPDKIKALRDCYRQVLQESSNVKESSQRLLGGEYGDHDLARQFLEFFSGTKRGFARAGRSK